MKINIWHIGWTVMLILNFIVGLVDFLQGGTAWPLSITVIFLMLALRIIK